MNLTDKYTVSGKTYKSFLDMINDVESNTRTAKVQDDDLAILSFRERRRDGTFLFYRITNESLNAFNNGISALPIVEYKPAYREEVLLLTETVNTPSGILLMVGNHIFLVSEYAITSLAARAGIRGTQLQYSSLVRNLYIAEGMFSVFKKKNGGDLSTIIYRTQSLKNAPNSKLKKVFAVMGQRFKHTSCRFMADVADCIIKDKRFGKVTASSWEMTHYQTYLQLDFSEYAAELQKKYDLKDKITPGIRLLDSEIGETSFRFRLTCRIGDGVNAILAEHALEHTCAFDIKTAEEWIADVDLSEFDALARKLKEQESVTLKTEQSRQIAFNKCARSIGLDKAIGKSVCFDADNSLYNTFTKTDGESSMYDMFKTIFMAEQTFDLLAYAKEKLSKACGELFAV